MSNTIRLKRTLLSILVIILFISSVSVFSKVDSYAATGTTKTTAKKIALNKKTVTITEGFCYALKLKNAKGKITWKSSKKSVATVTKKGRVEAIKPGKATITATYKGKKYKCVVTVKKAKLRPIDDIVVCKKPVMYFYPEADDTRVKVSLDFDGQFTTIYPSFTDEAGNRWEFNADRDGTIKIGDRQYSYLFWEGIPDAEYSIDTGYCVAKKDLIPFLEARLSELGLNARERNDFITYWLPELSKNKYNVISFDATNYTSGARLKIKPAPDTLIRVFMTFSGSDRAVKVKAPAKNRAVVRKGFTVVEWGGSELK